MKFLIWHIQKNQYWKPQGLGYTPDKSEAGRFTLQDAVEVVDDASKPGDPRHVLIPEKTQNPCPKCTKEMLHDTDVYFWCAGCNEFYELEGHKYFTR